MIRGRDNDDVARQSIDLQQQARYDALYFTCLVSVSPLFAHYVELVEEQHAGDAAYVIEQASEALRRLSEEAPDQLFVAHRQQRQAKALRDRTCERCLAVARRS